MLPVDKTLPDVGRMVPAINLSKVLLPAPLRPNSATLALVGNSAVMFSTITLRPPRAGNDLLSASSWIIGGPEVNNTPDTGSPS